MIRLLLGAALVFCYSFIVPTAAAQFTDTFSDGNLSADPPWQGTAGQWMIDQLNGDPALRSNGAAASDTIYLATPSPVSIGSWSFTFAYEGVNLSNFNGARVFLIADRADLSADVFGYYLQFGTNNSDEVRLYRQDGDPSASNRRVLLGQSTEPLLSGEAGTHEIHVSRTEAFLWTVMVDGEAVLTATDSTYPTSAYFGLWVKHTEAAAASYIFDTFIVEGQPGPTDTTPPNLTDARYDAATPVFSLSFSEAVAVRSVTATSFDVRDASDAAIPFTPDVGIGETFTEAALVLDEPLSSGAYTLSISGLADVSGNVMADTSLAFSVVVDNEPPMLEQVAALDAQRVEVVFDEPVRACLPERFEISNGIGAPAGFAACQPEDLRTTFTLLLSTSLQHAAAYTLTARDIADAAGNVLEEATAAFTFFDLDATPPPNPGDLVINEIFYDPPDSEWEFIEVLNRSDRSIDLSRLRFEDSRSGSLVISEAPRPLAPGSLAVLARNAEELRVRFPGIDAAEPPSWPSLNNDGDAVVLRAEDAIIDAVAYEPGWGGDGVSLERRDPDGPSSNRFNFGSSTAPEGATPGAPNSIYQPDREPPTVLVAEQVEDASLDLYLNEPADASDLPAATFQLDDGRVPIDVSLLDENARLRLRFDAVLTGTSLALHGLRDLTGNVMDETTVPLAFLARPGDLIINEILFDPLADRFDDRPDQPEYIELFNRSDRLLTLRGHRLAGRPNEDGVADTLVLGTDFFSVAPEGFAVAFGDATVGDDPTTDSNLARAFSAIDFSQSHSTLIPLPRTSLNLTNSGDRIALLRPDDHLLDEVIYDPAWHHPNLIDATGVSLERLLPNGASNRAENWTSSVAEAGGTPGLLNSIDVPAPGSEATAALTIMPRVFSPDQDGLDDVAAIQYTLESTANLVRVRIFDQRGRLVRTLEDAFLAGPSGRLLWDGMDDDGHDMRIGIYVVLFEALDTDGAITTALKKPVVLARPLN